MSTKKMSGKDLVESLRETAEQVKKQTGKSTVTNAQLESAYNQKYAGNQQVQDYVTQSAKRTAESKQAAKYLEDTWHSASYDGKVQSSAYRNYTGDYALNKITGQYNKAASEHNARSSVQKAAANQTDRMLADNIKGAKRTAQLSSGQAKANALAAADEYQNEQDRRRLATKDSVVDKIKMEADLQNAQESVRRANLQFEQAKTTAEKSAAVTRYEQAVKTLNQANAAAMTYDAQARYVMENASEETGKALTQELADLNAKIKQQKSKADKLLNAGDTGGYKAALANVQDSGTARKAARIQELIEINDYYKNKSNVITGMSDDEFSSYYAGYSEAENAASSHEKKAEQYRKEADKALTAGDSSAYVRLLGSANAERQAAEKARAQYADVDAQAKYTIETRASISNLESAAKSDRNAQRYINIGAKSDWTPKLREAVTNMLSKVGFSKQAEILMDQMTDTEKKVLQYYLGKNDTKSAQTYFSALEPTLESRNMAGVNQAAQEHPVMGLVANTAYNALQITGGTTLLGGATALENVMNSQRSEYTPPLSNTLLGGTASAIRSGTTEGIANAFLSDETKQMMEDAYALGPTAAAEKYGMTEQTFTEKLQSKQKGASFWAGQIVSISENVARNLGGRLSVGSAAKQLAGRGLSEEVIKAATAVDEWVPLILMGSGVATDTIQEKLQSGEPAWKAVIYGGIVGGAETLTEKMGLDEWLKGATGDFSSTMLGQFMGNSGIVNRAGLRNYVKTALGLANQALSEGGEEVISSLVDGFADVLINQDRSELMVNKRQYILDGYSDAEAESLAWRDWASEVGESFLGGFVSGGILGAFNIPSQLKYNNAIGQGVLDRGIQNAYALIEAGVQYAEDTETYRLANQMEQARDASQDYTPSAAALTDLALAMEQDSKAAVSTLDVAGASSTVLSATASGLISERLVTATEAQTMDKVLQKVSAGGSVTDTEIRTLHAERGGVQAKLSEILGVELANGSTGAVRAAIQTYQSRASQSKAQTDAAKVSKAIIREAEPYAKQNVLSESAAEVEGARAAGEAAAVQAAMDQEQVRNDLAAAQAEGMIAQIDRDTTAEDESKTGLKNIPYASYSAQYQQEHPGAASSEIEEAYNAANEAYRNEQRSASGNLSVTLDKDGGVHINGAETVLTVDALRDMLRENGEDVSGLTDDDIQGMIDGIREAAANSDGPESTVRMSLDDVAEMVAQTQDSAAENAVVEIGSVKEGQYSKEQPNKVMEWLAQDAKRIFGDMGIQDVSVDYEMSASENGCFKAEGGKPKIVLNGQLGDTTRNGVYYTAQDNIVFVLGHEIGHQAQGEDAGAWTDTIIQSYMDVNKGFSAEELESRITRTMEKYRNLAILEKLRGNDIGLKPSDVTRDYARTEVACDMLGEMMRDYNLIGRMKPEHRNLFQRVCDRVAEVRQNLSKLVKRKLNLDRGKAVSIQECYETAAESIETMLRDALQAAELRDGGVASDAKLRLSLDQYDEKQIENWSGSRKIVVYNNQEQLRQFVESARSDPNFVKRMYFGMVGEDSARTIMDATGIDLYGMNVTLRAGNVRKIFKDHGSISSEASRGQYAVTVDDFAYIPEVLENPDRIKRSTYNGERAVLVSKDIGEYRRNVFFAIGGKKSLDIFVQTMYIGKAKNDGRGIADMMDANSPQHNTSETTAGTTPANSNIAGSSVDVNPNARYSIDEEAGLYLSDADIQNGIREVAGMEPVASLTGEEFPKSAVDLTTQVTQFFDSIGNSVETRQIGTVILDRRSAKSDIAHGIGRKKAAAFTAVPDVLRNGSVIDFQENWKGRNYDTAVVAAPVEISGERYILGAVVTRRAGETRFYVHEVLAQKERAVPFKNGATDNSGLSVGTAPSSEGQSPFWTTASAENQPLPGGGYPSVLSLLQKVAAVNPSAEGSAARFSIDAIEEAKAEDERFRAEQKAEAARLNREAKAAEKAGDAERAASLRAEAADAKLMSQTDTEITMEAAKNAGLRIKTADELARDWAKQQENLKPKKYSEMTPQERVDMVVRAIMNRNSKTPSPKVSQTYSNTLVGGGLLTQAQTDVEGLRPQDMKYDPISEKQSLSEAAQRLEQDYMKWYRELPVKDGWTGVDLDTAMLIMGQLQKESQQSGYTGDVQRWAKVLQEHETFGGQFLQSIAKWTRTSAYIVAKATDTLDSAYINEKGDNKALKKIKDENIRQAKQLADQTAENETLDAEYQRLREQMAALDTELAAAESEGKDTGAEIRKAKRALLKATDRMQVLSDKANTLSTELEALTDKLQNKLAEVSSLSRENSAVLLQKHRLERQLAVAQRRHAQAEERNKELRAGLEALRNRGLSANDIQNITDAIVNQNQFMERFIRELGDQKTAANRAKLKAGQTQSAGGRQKAALETTNDTVNAQNQALQDDLASALGSDRKAKLIADMSEFANILDAMQEGDKKGVVDLIMEQARRRGMKPSARTRRMLMAQDWQYLHDFARTQLANIADDYTPRTPGKKLATWQYLAQLFNLRTSERNVLSNLAFYGTEGISKNIAAALDAGIGAITGNRTVGFSTLRRGDTGRLSAANDRATRAALEVRLDVDVGHSFNKYGEGSNRTFKKAKQGINGAVTRLLSNLEMVNGYSLNVTDEWFKGAVYQSTINSLSTLVSKGRLTQAEAEELATKQMLYNTFQDETFLGDTLNRLHDALNGDTAFFKKHDVPILNKLKGIGFGDFIVKYRTVPGALVTRALEYSPAGSLKAVYNLCQVVRYSRQTTKLQNEYAATGQMDENVATEVRSRLINAQNNTALGLARCLTGSGLIAVFCQLALSGILKNNDDEEDANAKAVNTAEGMGGTQINLSALGRLVDGESTEWQDGDNLIDIGFLDPLGSAITMGTMLAKDVEGGASWLERVIPANVNMAQAAFSDLSMMDTINDILYTVMYHNEDSDLGVVSELGITIATSMFTSIEPSLVRQLAQGIDPYYRDTYGGSGPIYDAIGGDTGKALQQAANEIAVNIPGLRQMIPTKLSSFGEERTYSDSTATNLMNALLNPGKYAKYNQSEAERALRMLYSNTGDASVYPDRNAPSSIQFGDERVRLTPDQKRQYLTTAGQLYKSMMGELMSSDAYSGDGVTNQQRVELLKELKSYAAYKAKQEVYAATHDGTYIDDRWNKTEAGMNLGLSFGEMRGILRDTSESSMPSDVDENGETIDGSREAKIMAYINELDQSDNTKLELYGIIRGSGAESSTQKLREIMDTGLSFFEATEVRAFYNELNATRDENADGMKDRDVFEKYLRDSGYTEQQREAINERYRFFTQIPQDENSVIQRLVGDGMDYDEAYRIASGLAELEPKDGEDSVSSAQKYDQIIEDISLSDAEKQAAIAAIEGSGSAFGDLSEATARALMSVYEATGITSTLSIQPADGVTIDHVRYEYSESQVQASHDAYIEMMDKMAGGYMTTADTVDAAKDIASNAAKYAAMQAGGYAPDLDSSDYSAYRKALQAQEVGMDLSYYVAIKAQGNSFTADKDINGNSISGSKKAKVVNYLNSLGLSSAQYNFFYSDVFGYK